MQMLRDDAEHVKIRLIEWLLQHDSAFEKRQKVIGVEVPFSPNRRKADVLVIGRDLHAFEIKGTRDRLDRLSSQLADYHRAFDRVTLVTTPNHLVRVRRKLKPSTGLLLILDADVLVVRKALRRSRLDKDSLLMFLRKREMANLLTMHGCRERSTDEVRRIAMRSLKLKQIRLAAIRRLRAQYGRLFDLFMKDKGTTIHVDDLWSLTGRVADHML
jgi:hypothetical protein